VRELRLALADGTDVAAALHPPEAQAPGGSSAAPVLLLPGARGDHHAEHLVAIATLLARAGHPIVRAALSSRPAGAGVVGPAERSVGRFGEVLAAARALLATTGTAERGWIVGGASYGGRVASLAVAAQGGGALGVAGLLLVAYPLHPPGRPERLRVAHFDAIDVPVLMLSGDADPFLTEALLVEHAPRIAGPLTRLVVPGGRHDLSVSSRSAPDRTRRSPTEAVALHADELVAWAAAR
jgi:predicted alpha/beta-hydrolase family hydrolase